MKTEVSQVSERTWRIAAISIFCIAAVLRLYDLNLVPLHHDEGVNGNFLVTLVREGRYHYDPANYHGPTLYYISALFPWILRVLFGTAARDTYGLNTIAIRLVPALFGLGTIALIFSLRRYLGTVATLAAALLMAISPGGVYLSRYFIHESLFVFFTLGIVVAGLKFYQARNPRYLLLASASAAMLFATKETAMISAGVLILALASTLIYRRLVGPERSRISHTDQRFIDELGGPLVFALWVGLAIIVFIAINVLFYSSFFENYPQGVYDSLKTFQIWSKTGKAAHVHPPETYLTWLKNQESALLFLGGLGAIFVMFNPKNSFALFSAFWAFGLIAAYSLVPYKTPWLALNFILPLSLIAGFAIQRIYELERGKLRLPLIIVGIATLIGMYQTIDLNFVNYDNDKEYYVYVYAHTKRGIKELVNDIDRIAKQGPVGGQTGITIVSSEYWPLPWYLRNYSRVGYFGHMTSSTEPIIIASEDQKDEVESTFGDLYEQVPSTEPGGAFSLRPGVNLLLYAKRSGVRQ
jgi:uncharacterized protein (TIGR03663 family)